MTQNLPKNIIGSVASIYQANLVIEIPNTTENYVNSHVFTCRHWLSAMLFKYMSRCWEVFLIGQIFFYSGGLRASWNVSGKLGMKLAIESFIKCSILFVYQRSKSKSTTNNHTHTHTRVHARTHTHTHTNRCLMRKNLVEFFGPQPSMSIWITCVVCKSLFVHFSL